MVASASEKVVLKVCALGFGVRAAQTLSAFFERQLGGSTVLADEGGADAVLIDLDMHGAKALLDKQMQERPDRPLIILSLNDLPQEISGGILVRKPIKIELFAAALTDLAKRLSQPKPECHFSVANDTLLQERQARGKGDLAAAVHDSDQIVQSLHSRESFFYIGSMPDIDLGSDMERRKIYYDPSQFLQGFVQKAIRNGVELGVVVRISAPAFGSVTVYPFAGKVMTRTPAPALCAAARIPLREKDVVVEYCRDVPHYPPDHGALEAIGPFLWKLALWASRGRLPAGTPTDAPVVLKRWPNLTRLLVPPHATRIAGLWMRGRHSLEFTAKTLVVPQRFVFAFYSACSALELSRVIAGQRLAAPPVAPSAKKVDTGEKRNIFRMLLNKLIGSRED